MAINDDQYELRGPDAEGKGALTDKGFLVKAGSLARRAITLRERRGFIQIHEWLLSEGVLETHGEQQLRFTRDHLFDTPSGASSAILGRHSNGLDEWKRADGAKLRERFRPSTSKGTDGEPLTDIEQDERGETETSGFTTATVEFLTELPAHVTDGEWHEKNKKRIEPCCGDHSNH